MSGGRAIAGIGTGDEATRPEAEAFGLPLPPPGERRKLLEETVLACKALFRADPWPGGELVPPMRGPIVPPTSTPGGPPMWLGGTSEAVVRVAARVGDGWNGWGLDEDRFAARAGLLGASAREAGRAVEATWAGLALVGNDSQELEGLLDGRRERGLDVRGLWTGTAEDLVRTLHRLAGAGATWGVLMLAGPSDRIDLVAERVLPAVKTGP
jgi:alkanesulfonate monooxygenase SsuD/methylene tetrahydromethanopterin reductase-like flavin-dependent oxidoreductase (luciferase family)